MSTNYLTKQGLSAINQELKELLEIELPRVQEEIKDARAMGDLRENSALDAAKVLEETISIRIAEINTVLENYELIDEEQTTTTVKIGSSVDISYEELKHDTTVHIVGVSEVSPNEGKISNESPLAKAILGKKVGAKVQIKVRDSNHTVKISKIY
jgi:transcription elongation factor GreA